MNFVVLSDFSPVSAAPVDGAFCFRAQNSGGESVARRVGAHRRGALVAKKGPASRCGGGGTEASLGGKGIDRIFFQSVMPRPVPGVFDSKGEPAAANWKFGCVCERCAEAYVASRSHTASKLSSGETRERAVEYA